MRFSEFYGITRSPGDDWFDTLMTTDTRLYVDPFRVYADPGPSWTGSHDHLLAFFSMVMTYVAEAKNNDKHPAWQKAKNLLLFPEPQEFCLGMAVGSPKGAGSGPGLQEDMLVGAKAAVNLGMQDLEHMEMLVLFSGGIGVDRISDMVCNVLKSYFIRYTQAVCKKHGVPTKKFKIRHSSWDESHGRWVDGHHDLPANPFFPTIAVILTPERFLREIPTVDPSEFWNYAWVNEGEQLRGDFNYDLGKNVPAAKRAQMARQHPEIVKAYLSSLEKAPPPAYDVTNDPHWLVKWWEAGQELALKAPLSLQPQGPADFPAFVESILAAFSQNLENGNGWTLLWDGNRPRSEKIVQAFFHSTVVHYCRANKVVISPESNAGRGPVDFKFNADWSRQALVEMKLTNNSSYWNGLQEQLVQYLKSEETNLGYFVSVGFTDADFTKERMNRVVTVAARVSTEVGRDVRAMFIDARKKQSASKLKSKAPKEK